MLTPEQLQSYISVGLLCEHIEVTGDGAHFYATIVASVFEGQSRVTRQRTVFAVLGERMHEEIHALSMKIYTPAEWGKEAANG